MMAQHLVRTAHNPYYIRLDICDEAQVWGRPKATEHTKECLLPRRPGC